MSDKGMNKEQNPTQYVNRLLHLLLALRSFTDLNEGPLCGIEFIFHLLFVTFVPMQFAPMPCTLLCPLLELLAPFYDI